MSKLEKAVVDLRDELIKAKYISKKPDGKGGFIYTYPKDLKGREKKQEERTDEKIPQALREKEIKINSKIKTEYGKYKHKKNYYVDKIIDGFAFLRMDTGMQYSPKWINIKTKEIHDFDSDSKDRYEKPGKKMEYQKVIEII